MANPKKRKDGRYVKRVPIGVDEKNKTKYITVYAKTLKELNEKTREVEEKYNSLSKTIITDLTIESWLDLYLKKYCRAKPQTISNYKIILGNLKILFPIKLTDLTNMHLQQFIDKSDNQYYASVGVRTLGTTLKIAYKLGYINANPVDRVLFPKIDKKKKDDLNEEENTAFLEAVKNVKLQPHQRILFYIMYYTGLRVGEGLALSPRDIDLDNQTITVNKTLVYFDKQLICQNTTKSQCGNRTVPMPNVLVELLKPFLESGYQTEDKLFHYRGNYMYPTYVNALITRKLIPYMKEHNPEVNIRDFTPHTLRHNYATNMVYMGVNIKTLQRLMGHSTIDMTLIEYARSRNDNEKVIELMNAAW